MARTHVPGWPDFYITSGIDILDTGMHKIMLLEKSQMVHCIEYELYYYKIKLWRRAFK